MSRLSPWLMAVLFISGAFAAQTAFAGSVAVTVNDAGDYDYGHLTWLPANFGEGEFTFEVWIKLDASFPIGSTTSGEDQRLNWSDADNQPYSFASWWWQGNFLLDGHNNTVFQYGTFSLQFYGGGRVRWLFGDGWNAGPGGHWSVGAYPASTVPTLLDGAWHSLIMVRRFAEGDGSDLELWIDGVLIAVEWTPARTDMRAYWHDWTGFPMNQEGWFWGAEKMAAISSSGQYEDFKGNIGEMRFFNRARSAAEIATHWAFPVDAATPGLVGLFKFSEGTGHETCDEFEPARCLDLVNMKSGYWSTAAVPIGEIVFRDGFEFGSMDRWTVGN